MIRGGDGGYEVRGFVVSSMLGECGNFIYLLFRFRLYSSYFPSRNIKQLLQKRHYFAHFNLSHASADVFFQSLLDGNQQDNQQDTAHGEDQQQRDIPPEDQELDYLSFIHKFGEIIQPEGRTIAGSGDDMNSEEGAKKTNQTQPRTLAYGAGWLRKLG